MSKITKPVVLDESFVSGIQSVVNALNNVADDIVATYADLSGVTAVAGHRIKVLADETHENRISYYRYSGTAWVYIGSLNSTATLAQNQAIIDNY